MMRLPAALFFIFIAAVSARAGSERLTWGPANHLRQGFRTVPWSRDPFYAPDSVLKVSGVISDRMAYINGRWVQPGDKVEGYTVDAISPQRVTLVRRGEITVLKVGD